MENKIIFARENFGQKNPKYLQKNVFIIYSPRALKIDTELAVFLR